MTTVMDPRIEERRNEVAGASRTRRRRIALLVCGAFIVVGLVVLAIGSSLLDVDVVRVEGTASLDADAVRDAAAVEEGEPLLRVDTDAVRRRVEALPWVASADVSRSLPGTVTITVHEHEPVAFTRRASTVALLTANGVVVADVAVPPEGLVEIVGVRNVPGIGKLLSPPEAPGVVRELPEALATRVTAIDLGGEGVALDLTGGGSVRLCTVDDIEAKAAAALAVLERLGDDAFTYIDVCAPQNPVAR